MNRDPAAAAAPAGLALIHDGRRRGSPVVLGLPAMGTPASYYEPFARELAQASGATVAFADLRGQGTSPYRARRGDDFGYREIVEEDLPALVDHLVARYPARPLVLLGHSLGGQLATLAAHQFEGRLAGIVLVAAGTAHHRAWPAGRRLLARAVVGAISCAARVLPWYPGHRLGFGGEQPRRLMRDWTVNATTGHYAIEGARMGHQWATRCLDVPVLSVGVRDDPVAPRGAREELLALLESATVTREEIDGVREHARWQRHFSWARRPEGAVGKIAAWMARAVDCAAPRPDPGPLPRAVEEGEEGFSRPRRASTAPTAAPPRRAPRRLPACRAGGRCRATGR